MRIEVASSAPICYNESGRMRMFRIQTLSTQGWSDLKSSDDGDNYSQEIYPTEAEAQAEIDFILSQIPDFELRIVSSDQEEDCSIY